MSETPGDYAVAYQGAPGAFSEEAARQLCGLQAVLRPCRTLEDVFGALGRREVAAAVIPVENSIAGAVPGSRDFVARYGADVRQTIALPVIHALIAPPGVTIRDVTEVHSHLMALAQCRRFLDAHPMMTPVPAFDTAGAVADLMRRPAYGAAAIASSRAAAHWGAVVLQDHIQDRPDNLTEFWLVTLRD